MSLQCGIVGLPNVGKSTLFNALTKAGIAAENYPFCTIEPNVGVVEVPDPRLARAGGDRQARAASCRQSSSSSTSPGLVAGASQGRRARQPVPRAHPRDRRDRQRRALLRRRERRPRRRQGRSGRRHRGHPDRAVPGRPRDRGQEPARYDASRQGRRRQGGAAAGRRAARSARPRSNEAQPVRASTWSKEERAVLKPLCLITAKPAMYVANVAEDGFENNPHLDRLRDYAARQKRAGGRDLRQDRGRDRRPGRRRPAAVPGRHGPDEPGLDRLIRAAFALLGLQTYFTAGRRKCARGRSTSAPPRRRRPA